MQDTAVQVRSGSRTGQWMRCRQWTFPYGGPDVVRKRYHARNGLCYVTFSLGPISARRIAVVGEFNDWDPNRHLMIRRKNGVFSITIPLSPGRPYRFRYLIDDHHWLNDPEADGTAPNPFGTEDSIVHT